MNLVTIVDDVARVGGVDEVGILFHHLAKEGESRSGTKFWPYAETRPWLSAL